MLATGRVIKTLFSALVSDRKTNSCTLFSSVVGREPGAMPTARRGRGTCPLTGGFAAKWHRRINGYDPRLSKPSGFAAKWHHEIPVMASAITLLISIKSSKYESIGYA
ncbi:hypothetical protein MA16_Dca016275 [Dendrobium catenatum]|uniref:Uncharacterized protein n=1 Tax=Dendrobium catenatum TaxID=906689 RepID=A0A2I0WVY3_9ASPA|nr:hypothetical protein MA16_Dca016275 [Dendrobium catenatum]